MIKEELKFDDDKLFVYTPLPQYGEGVCKAQLVMTKEIFQECYKKWIEPQKNENQRMTIEEHISRIKARGFKYKEDKEIALQSLEALEKIKEEIRTPIDPTKNKDYDKGREDEKEWMWSIINKYMRESEDKE